jgi:L-alanine-DL-glutamate epimerase-like enolase superfamily enzyme
MPRIISTALARDSEPLSAPFGFKGGYLSQLWQVIVRLSGESGQSGVGVGVQSVLWSDPSVFVSHSEQEGNELMLALTQAALEECQGASFDSPLDLVDHLYPFCLERGKVITGRPDLRPTFALNALVAVDFAAWLLYAQERGISAFDDLIPQDCRTALNHRHNLVASVPVIGYGATMDEVVQAVRDGYFLLKIKIGADPDKDGDPEKMLAFDQERLRQIHAAVGSLEVAGYPDARARYYLDANGRYDSKERILALLKTVEQIGAMNRTVLLEEPFPESATFDVSDLPVRVVADESAHTDRDALERIHLGYGAIALKPIAKTLSMSFKVAKVAHDNHVPCFCADLTVNPLLVEWNRQVASRLAPLPGLDMGVVETNGAQFYKNWDTMKTYHPANAASWTEAVNGVFHLNEEYWARSGGVFETSDYYKSRAAE